MSSAIYGRVQGDPLRLLTNERQAPVVLDRIAKRCTDCWRWMDEQIAPRRFLLGDELGIAVRVSCWSPRRKRFYSEAPKRFYWWSQGESNPRPLECHSSALPTELWPRFTWALGEPARLGTPVISEPLASSGAAARPYVSHRS